MADYSFRDIQQFNLDRYTPLVGWIGDKPQKIYSRDGSEALYLFDEVSRQLFEFDVVAPPRWKDPDEYKKIVHAFLNYTGNDRKDSVPMNIAENPSD